MEWWLILIIVIASLIVFCIFMRLIFNRPRTDLSKDLTDYIIIVTGSSAGIGKITAFELLKKGATVIFACRNQNKTNEILNTLPEKLRQKAIFIKLDLSSLTSVENFVKEFTETYEKLDILINNAGQINENLIVTSDGLEQTLQCNHISVTYLTTLLYPIMRRSKTREISVGSDAHTMTKLEELESYENALTTKDYDNCKKNYAGLGFNQYAFSKIGNNYMVKFFTEYSKIKNDNLIYNCLHPGFVFSDIFRIDKWWKVIIAIFYVPIAWLISKTEYVGSQTTLHLCYLDSPNSGDYYQDCNKKKESSLALDETKMKRYMKFTFNAIRSIKNLNFDESIVLG